jgi:hypothetical protein
MRGIGGDSMVLFAEKSLQPDECVMDGSRPVLSPGSTVRPSQDGCPPPYHHPSFPIPGIYKDE